MKNSLLIALLGLTVSVVTPSIAAADDFKFGPNKSYKNDQNRSQQHRNHKQSAQKHRTYKQNSRDAKKHASKQYNSKHKQTRRVVKAKPPKPSNLPHKRIIRKLDNKIHNKHRNDKRYVTKRHHNKPKSSFSVTWSSSAPNVIYNRGYNTGNYNNAPRHVVSIFERQKRQQRRIQQGRESGQLVRREVKQLRKEQRHIQNKIGHYKRDGRFNRHEKSRINQMQDVASNNIRNKRNNRLTRWSQPKGNQDAYAWH